MASCLPLFCDACAWAERMKARVSSIRVMLSSHGNHWRKYKRLRSVRANSSSASRNSNGVSSTYSETGIDCMGHADLSDYTRGMSLSLESPELRLAFRMCTTRLALATALLALVSTASLAQSPGIFMIPVEGKAQSYWPRWRGPSGQGVVKGKGYPDRWSSTQNVLWRTPIPGRGHSSPIVWENQIIVTTSRDDGHRLSIISYRRSDGEHLWETDIPDGPGEHIQPKNTRASATPSTDGKRVYVSFGSRGLVAVSMDGTLAWHRNIGEIDNYHGTAGSPLLYKDLVITYQDHANGSFVAAFDARHGEPVWRTAREAKVGWGTPVAVRVGDHDEIIVSSERTVTAYDPEQGSELWRCEGNLREVIPTPVVGHGLIFCTSGRAGPTLAIRPGGTGDVTETHVAWRTSRGSPFVPSPLVYGDYLYTVNDMSSIVTCFKAATGKVMWQQRLGRPTREGFSASPIAVDGKIFFTNDNGQTFVVRAGPEFEQLHTNYIGTRTLSSPALVDGRWYIRTEHELLAIGE